jgi:hypothetical protein
MLLSTNPILSLLILTLTATTSLAASLPFSTSIFSWPLTSDTPTLLAEISYNPTSLATSLDSYLPPKPVSDETSSLIRIGLYNKDTKEWTGTIASLSSLPDSTSSRSKNTTLNLHLNPSNLNEIYHVSLSSSTSSPPSTDSKSKNDPLQITILRPTAGPTPQLSKPVAPRQNGGDGKGEEGEEEEKTLFQK